MWADCAHLHHIKHKHFHEDHKGHPMIEFAEPEGCPEIHAYASCSKHGTWYAKKLLTDEEDPDEDL
jgi:hypothetical protein